MSKYFIYSHPNTIPIYDKTKSQIISLDTSSINIYILPRNNLSYHVDNGLFEATLIDWCKQFCNKDSIILDIGAHTGTYAISLAKYTKKVLAFEPQRMTYYGLCGSIALSNITNIECFNYGLGSNDQVGEQTLNIISIDGGGSSLHIEDQNRILDKEIIQIRTLDSLNIIDPISFIKIDIEDNELFALQGSRETIKKNKNLTILFECNSSNPELFNYITNELEYDIVKLTGCSNMYLATYRKKY